MLRDGFLSHTKACCLMSVKPSFVRSNEENLLSNSLVVERDRHICYSSVTYKDSTAISTSAKGSVLIF